MRSLAGSKWRFGDSHPVFSEGIPEAFRRNGPVDAALQKVLGLDEQVVTGVLKIAVNPEQVTSA